MDRQSGTWHYGLIARWWAEFNVAEPHEIDYYRSAIEKFGEPVVDLGCGTGRFLVPLALQGFDIDGVDVSADMIAAARALVPTSDAMPGLFVQGLHELNLRRAYRTAYMCGVFGLGGRRENDRGALRRVYQHLEPGGALLIIHQLPYHSGQGWEEWLPGHRPAYPLAWPDEGNRRTAADGDDIELLTRVEGFDPLEQKVALGMRARLWRHGAVVSEESYRLESCLYFAQEIVQMLVEAGFRDVAIEGNYTGKPATGDDGDVIFVARR